MPCPLVWIQEEEGAMLVHIVADYGPAGDLAFAEVVQRIKLHLPDAEPVLTPVPPFATLAAGFCIAQLGLNDAPAGTIIYHNVAPRQDLEEAREANAGERLAFARLPTGVRVIGVNAGHAFSFVRDAADDLRWAAVPAAGSQFRSRDLFPQAAAAIALGHPDALAETIDPGLIPDVPECGRDDRAPADRSARAQSDCRRRHLLRHARPDGLCAGKQRVGGQNGQ